MPRRAKGPYLWHDDKLGLWYVRDGQVKRGTGCRSHERAKAEEALGEYIGQKYTPPTSSSPGKVTIADILAFYSSAIAPGQRSSATTAYAVDNLSRWWKARPLSDIKRSTCQEYVDHRTSQSIPQAKTEKARQKKVSPETARRELTVLRAALNAFHAENPLDALPVVTLPPASVPRVRWLTRSEAAALLWAARSNPDRKAGRALVRFILLALYTGTRSGALRDLAWMPNTIGGWIDIEKGVLHRRGEGEAITKKRKPAIRIPDRLMGTLQRWHAADMREIEAVGGTSRATPFVVHYRGAPVDGQRRAWERARTDAKLGQDVTPHVLRHTAVTWLLLGGEEPWDVANYVGMTLKMIEDVYGHHHPDFQKGIASRIGRK